MFFLANAIVYFILALVFPAIVKTLYGLAVLLPFAGIGVRRLHDSGRSGWWLILVAPTFLAEIFPLQQSFIFAVFLIDHGLWLAGAMMFILFPVIILVLLVNNSTEGENHYGQDASSPGVIYEPAPVPSKNRPLKNLAIVSMVVLLYVIEGGYILFLNAIAGAFGAATGQSNYWIESFQNVLLSFLIVAGCMALGASYLLWKNFTWKTSAIVGGAAAGTFVMFYLFIVFGQNAAINAQTISRNEAMAQYQAVSSTLKIINTTDTTLYSVAGNPLGIRVQYTLQMPQSEPPANVNIGFPNDSSADYFSTQPFGDSGWYLPGRESGLLAQFGSRQSLPGSPTGREQPMGTKISTTIVYLMNSIDFLPFGVVLKSQNSAGRFDFCLPQNVIADTDLHYTGIYGVLLDEATNTESKLQITFDVDSDLVATSTQNNYDPKRFFETAIHDSNCTN